MKLVIKNLAKSFEKKEVLKGINFEFEEGKIYGLLGRNGAGKTTLFNCLNEDIELTSGEFFLKDEREEKKLQSNDIGYVLSTPVVPEFLTGREFIKFFLEINKDIKSKMNIDDYFDLVKINKEDRDLLLKDYSHGMKNKMQMLVNIIASPKIMLLDEPLTSFDVVVAEEMEDILKQNKKDHIIIFSTHIMDLALSLCDEIVLLNNGVLSIVEKNELNNEDLRKKIINLLKEDNDDK